jgi:hypothetical protein
MKAKLHSVSVASVLLALMVTLICGSSAQAQDGVKGKFVLPFEVQWQGKTLPAGEYDFILRSSSGVKGKILLLRDAQDQHNIMLIEEQSEESFKGRNALTVVNRNGKRYVSSLAFDAIGATLVYSLPTRRKAAEHQLDASVQIIPVHVGGS